MKYTSDDDFGFTLAVGLGALFFIILISGAMYLDYSNDQAIINNCNAIGGKLIAVKGDFICETR